MTTSTTIARPTASLHTNSSRRASIEIPTGSVRRLGTALVYLLAATGAVLAVVTLVAGLGRPTAASVGEQVRTSFGSVTITRTNLAFVPQTQGVPTMAKMNGTEGTQQLQVWVRLTNTSHDQAAYSWRQFALQDTAGHRLRPQGASLGAATLPAGSSVDAQVWFDLDGQSKSLSRRLVFLDADGRSHPIELNTSGPTLAGHEGDEDAHAHHH